MSTTKTLNEIETIDKVIEMCNDFRTDMLETGNKLLVELCEASIAIKVSYMLYTLGFNKNGWINFSPYDGSDSLSFLSFIKEDVTP